MSRFSHVLSQSPLDEQKSGRMGKSFPMRLKSSRLGRASTTYYAWRKAWQPEQEAERSRPQLRAGSRESQREMSPVFKLSKPATSDTFYPTGPHLLDLTKQHHELGTKCVTTWAYRGHFHSSARSGHLLVLYVSISAAFELLRIPPAGWSTPFLLLPTLCLDHVWLLPFLLWEQTAPSAPSMTFVTVLMTSLSGWRCCCCCYCCCCCCCCSVWSQHWVINPVRTGIVCLVLHYVLSTSYIESREEEGMKTWAIYKPLQCCRGSSRAAQRAYSHHTILAGHCVHTCHLGIQEANAEESWVQGQPVSK